MKKNSKKFKVLITWQSIIKKINIYKKILKKISSMTASSPNNDLARQI